MSVTSLPGPRPSGLGDSLCAATGTALAGTARLVAGTVVTSLAELPPSPSIIVANHTSHLDTLVLWSCLGRERRHTTRPVAAADYWRGPVRGPIARRVFRAVLVERRGGGAHSAIDAMLAVLGDGESLILFPEGTRGDGKTVGRFRSGLYRLCIARPDIAVVPVHLQNLNRVMPKGAALPVPMLSRMTIGPATHLQPDEERDVFLERMRVTVAELAQAA